jgi:DNA-binding winged helix-turn-helix (wHTH) protein
MLPSLRRGSFVRFGPWEFDTSTGELFKGHTRVRLQEQPCLILAVLLKRSGELVSREELYRLLWGQDTHVDYDHALNMAVAKIRRVLNDSPDKPRFIETIPKHGSANASANGRVRASRIF